MDPSLPQVVEIVKTLAAEQSRYILDHWSSPGEITYKNRRDMGTSVEVCVEKNIIKTLSALFPDHGFDGEETGKSNSKAPYQWLIDPIDGTKNYVSQSSLFAVSIGLLFHGQPILGVVHNSAAQQCFSAYKGGGAFLDDRKLHGPTTTQLSEAIANIDAPSTDTMPVTERTWVEEKWVLLLRKLYRLRNLGAGSLAACWLATGALDVYLDLTGYVRPYDLAAGRIIMEEAGAKVEFIDVGVGPLRLLAAPPVLHSKLRSLLLQNEAGRSSGATNPSCSS